MPTGQPDYPAVTEIAAQDNRTGLTGALGTTPLLTPVGAGFYIFLASLFLNNVSGGNDSVTFKVSYTQNGVPIFFIAATASINVPGVALAYAAVPAFVDAATLIAYGTDFTHGAGDTYDLHVRLLGTD